MSDNGSDSDVVENLRRQVREYQERMEQEGITDQQEIDNYLKLHKLLVRAEENAGQAKPKSKQNVFPDDQMTTFEFLDAYYGENEEFQRIREERFDAGLGCPFHARLLLIPDGIWMEWEALKPKLILPITLNIPL